MIHMNVYFLSDVSQKQFYGIVGQVDESQNNGLSNDNQ